MFCTVHKVLINHKQSDKKINYVSVSFYVLQLDYYYWHAIIHGAFKC